MSFAGARGGEDVTADLAVDAVVCPGVPGEFALGIRETLRPLGASSSFEVFAASCYPACGKSAQNRQPRVLAVSGNDASVACDVYRRCQKLGTRCAVALPADDAGSKVRARRDLFQGGVAFDDMLVGTGEECAEAFVVWLSSLGVRETRILADASPRYRDVLSRRAVAKAALGNLAIGATGLRSRSEMPLMLANEATLLVRLAAVNGLDAKSCLPWAACTVLAGPALRGAYRLLARRMPGAGYLARLAVAGIGTYAAGMALDAAMGAAGDEAARAAGEPVPKAGAPTAAAFVYEGKTEGGGAPQARGPQA